MRNFGLTLSLSLFAHVGVAMAIIITPHGSPASDPAKHPDLAGETFELPAPETADVPLANASPSPEAHATPAAQEGDAPARPSPPSPKARRAERASRQARPSGGRADPGETDGTGAGAPGLYGAVGERSATDLATTFTRGFPQASSADPVWRTTPLGSAGEADVLLTLDESGHIESTQVTGTPSAALSSAIRRTIALIKGRPFVAKGKVTRLHLVASVSHDEVHDGLHGDVFAIGGSFAASEGNAFFALAIGRRIDVRVRLR